MSRVDTTARGLLDRSCGYRYPLDVALTRTVAPCPHRWCCPAARAATSPLVPGVNASSVTGLPSAPPALRPQLSHRRHAKHRLEASCITSN